MKQILLLICFWSACDSANILGLFQHPGKSHHILGEVLFKELARRGHNLTMISPFPLKDKFPNYTDIDLPSTRKDMEDRIKKEWFQRFSENSASPNTFQMILEIGRTHCEMVFEEQAVQDLIAAQPKFDLIIIDWLFSESLMSFGHIFNAPIIIIASYGSSIHTNQFVGNPTPYAYVPYKFFPLSDNMTFQQRMLNVLLHSGLFYFTVPEKNAHQTIIDKYVPSSPDIDTLFDKHFALILSNGHYTFETIRPSVPNVIDVGGFHVREPKPLPKDLQEYLDNAKEGVIYFSLGSNMKSVFLGKERRDAILRALGKVKQRVLWKFEDDELPNKPGNVKIAKWLPQNGILAHPNVKLFITHGGLLSTIESVYHAKPFIGIPMFGDQNSNIPTAVEAGMALQILPTEMTEANFDFAIKEILSNPIYAKNAKFRSDLLRNQEMPAMEKAVFWVEHVIKHRGAKHLRNASLKLNFVQNMLLDVFGAIFIVLSIVIWFVVVIVKRCLKLLTPSTKQKKS